MLSDTRVRAAKPREKAYKLYDERGLFLFVTPTGGRLWRLKYRVRDREKLISLGAYPDVGLKRAREKRDEARKLLADGIDPSATSAARHFSRRSKVWPSSGARAPEQIPFAGNHFDPG